MALSNNDKRWLIRLAQTVVYLICTHYAYLGNKVSRGSLKNHFAALMPKAQAEE